MDSTGLIEAVKRIAPEAVEREQCDTPAVTVPLDKLLTVLETLRDGKDTAFDMLFDHLAIDWPERECFELNYRLFSTVYGHSLVVGTEVPRNDPVAPTALGIWPGAEWHEREVYDLMGVRYDGHPDLRRVFLDDDWEGHPLRKDYEDPDMLALPS